MVKLKKIIIVIKGLRKKKLDIKTIKVKLKTWYHQFELKNEVEN
jgi:hypothetical protein